MKVYGFIINIMFQNRVKVTLLAVLAAFMLALSGCGGSGSTTATVDPPPPPPMECPDGQVGTYPDCMDPPPTAEERIAAAQGRAGTAATNARADADAAAMLDHQDDTDVAAAVTAAENAATAAEIARDLADAATNPDAAEALATQAETAEGNADSALTNATRASIAAQTAIDTAARIAATTKAAETKAKAIEAEGAQTTDAGLGGTDAPTTTSGAEGEYTLAIDSDGTTVSITVEGATNADDEKLVLATDMMDGRTMHTRTHKADADGNVMTEVVIVAEDRDEPEPVDFAKFKVVAADGTETTPQTLDVSTDTANDSPAVTFEALSIVAGNLTNVKADGFKAAAGTIGTITPSFQGVVADDASTTDVDESKDGAEVRGTFNGSMGTYRCVATGGTNCTATFDAKGVVSGVSADAHWAFIPDTDVKTDQPDYDFLHYGFWLKRTADKDDVTTYNEVETFSGSSINASTGSELDTVRGSASYTGDAVGVYVHRTFATDGETEATSGHFKAEVNLTAIFGQIFEGDNPSDTSQQGTIADNMLNTVAGTIDKFELSGGEANTWSVAVAADRAASGSTFAGTAKGGDGDGSISGTFYGLTPETEVTTDGDRRDAPGSMAGEFNAGFTNGSVAGAFGARLEE